MTFLLQVLLVVVVKLSGIWAFSRGPPLRTCEYMVPHHKDNKAQTREPPYSISVSSISYTAGEYLTVKISGTNTFKGYILQAQGIKSSVSWPVGKFVEIPSGAHHVHCSGGDPKNTVARNNTGGKFGWNSLTFTWMAPAKSAGNITFVATIFHNYTTFWTKIASSVVAGPPAESFQISKDGCGETKSCFSEPEGCTSSSDCQYLVTIKPVGSEDSDDAEVEFELTTTEQWASIGFNNEKNKMPGTDALICAAVGRKVSVDHYKVDGYDHPTKTTPRPASLVLDFGEFSGGVLSCRFRRRKKDDKMVDLRESWYLVYAIGPMSEDAIGKHRSIPKTSPEKFDVGVIGTPGADNAGPEMIQAHGCLMVIAWVGFASIGIFMARYMKVAFGEKVLLGTKVWFTFHRSLLILTVLFTIVSTIIIFVHAGRWTKEAGAHPYTGIIVLVLAVIQPIMALFRPHPGEDKRYIFNWAHRGVGLSSLILAVVTVFLGIRLPDSNLDDSALYAMIVYCVGVATVIVFEFYLTLKKDNKAARFSSTEGNKDGGGHVVLPPSGDQFLFARQLMLGFLVVLVSGVVIALVVLIAIDDGEGGHKHEH